MADSKASAAGESENGIASEIAKDVKDAINSQRALVDEVVEHSRLARKSQHEAQAARQLVFALSALVEHLRSHLAAVTGQRDRLIEQLHDQTAPPRDDDELRRRLAQTQREVVLANRLHQQSQQELVEVREQLRVAEELASEAQRRLVEYQATSESGPHLDDCRQLLKDLTHDRIAHQRRVHEIEQELNELPTASADPGQRPALSAASATAGQTAEAASSTEIRRNTTPNGNDQKGGVAQPSMAEANVLEHEPPPEDMFAPVGTSATHAVEEPGAVVAPAKRSARRFPAILITALLLVLVIGDGALAWYGAVDVPLRYSEGDKPRGSSLSDGFEWNVPAHSRLDTTWRGLPTDEVKAFSGHLILDGGDGCRSASISWTLLVNGAEVADGILEYESYDRAIQYLDDVDFREYLHQSGSTVQPTRVELRAHRLDRTSCQSRLTWYRAGFDLPGPGRHPWNAGLGIGWSNLMSRTAKL